MIQACDIAANKFLKLVFRCILPAASESRAFGDEAAGIPFRDHSGICNRL